MKICQEVQQNFANGFSENKFLQGKWVILDPKMHWVQIWIPLRTFLKFCTMKEARKCREIKLMVFLEKNYLGQLGQFGPKI